MITWLPRRRTREVLYFDSSTIHKLPRFFDDIETLAADFQKDKAWMSEQVMYYVAMSCSKLWATVPELKKSRVCNWSTVKREIRGLYLELTDG